jgi:phospholipid/cholesterol/gamma-HCH transport system ATP-binding protein
MPKTIIDIENLNISFKDNHVLKKFDLKVRKGDIVCVMGRSGSGKSVLLKCIAGLLKPDSGRITLFDKDLSHITEKELNLLRINLGFVFQGSALYDSFTVRQNLEFALTRNKPGLSDEEADRKIQKALTDVGLAQTIKMYPSELSGGMQKRIAIARAIVMEPELILFDEPTAGLDIITSREISRLILKLQKEYQSAMLIITHDLESIRILHQQVAILNNGENQWQGPYEEMKLSSNPLIQEYLNPEEINGI